MSKLNSAVDVQIPLQTLWHHVTCPFLAAFQLHPCPIRLQSDVLSLSRFIDWLCHRSPNAAARLMSSIRGTKTAKNTVLYNENTAISASMSSRYSLQCSPQWTESAAKDREVTDPW